MREFLKKILPPPVRTFLREMTELRRVTERQGQELARLLVEQNALLEKQAAVLAAQIERTEELQQTGDMLVARVEVLHQTNEALTARLEQAEKERKALAEAVERVRKQSVDGARSASEAVWAETFNNAISGSTWLKNTAFSPGRWAVGYPVLYVMYRVLNESQPRKILELGLGQSTRMIAQYAAAHEGVEHIVVEHDPEWIAFFRNDFSLSERTRILQLDREIVPYKDAEAVRVFKGFREVFAGQKFDFIFIDAPLGGDMKQYARIDVLGLLPECLTENFVILIDDAERSGETRTIAEIRKRLEEAGVLCKCGRYSGKKDCMLICAEHNGFLTTM